MKTRSIRYAAAVLAAIMLAVIAAGCGASKPQGGSSSAEASMITCDISDMDYANVFFDYAEQIEAEKAAAVMVPEAAAIGLSAADENGATGVLLVPSMDESNTTDYYLNAFVAGSALNFSGNIAYAYSSVTGELSIGQNGLSYYPAVIDADEPVDEVITFTMADQAVYNVHMIPEEFPDLMITGDGVNAVDAGVYTFSLDKFLIRINTDKKILYYRNLNCTGHEYMAEGFAPQPLDEKQYYSAFVELHPEFRNANGGFSSGCYIVMDENYRDKDVITLYPNDDDKHTHGEGYLDQHEFIVMDEDHYMLLSYTPMLVDNLPPSLKGIDGESKAYVWAGIIQEVRNGEVIAEINTADYPILYESAVEKNDYAGSTDQGVNVTVGQNEVFSIADGIQDYTHVNSMDYTLNPDGTADKLLVSMRDQSAVYQFDMKTGQIEWILGGKASTLSGFDEYTSLREDDNGAEFNALTFGQHFARYTNKSEDGTIEGDPVISIFDNQTGAAPFLTAAVPPTLTRVFKAEINEKKNTAKITDVIEGIDLNEKSGKYHNASHCGSVQYNSDTSVMIGWGLHGVIDNLGPMVPEGTMKDAGFDDLRIGSRPVFIDYDPAADTITFELSGTRNPKLESGEAFFSYRTYKSVK